MFFALPLILISMFICCQCVGFSSERLVKYKMRKIRQLLSSWFTFLFIEIHMTKSFDNMEFSKEKKVRKKRKSILKNRNNHVSTAFVSVLMVV